MADEIGSVFVANYPPFSFWQAEHAAAATAALDRTPRPGVDLGLYLHIPFCRRRCHFCYFRVYTDKDARQIARYTTALAREVEILAGRPAIAGRRPRFVYFGGGTPSYISVDRLRGLVDRVTAALPWKEAEEITFECEPGTLTRTKLEAIRGIGVTRLSLGIESFDDAILERNGRAHRTREIAEIRPWLTDLDFDQVNVDLIAGMLGETWDTWRASVRQVIEYDPDSVTIYQLELPYNTTFTRQFQDGDLEVPPADWELKRAWHDWAFAELETNGYELSSAYTMVKRGGGSRFVYRNALWRGADMLGTGVASFSHLSGVHFQNADRWDDYLEAIDQERLPIGRAFPTSARERLTRELILQLKLGRLAIGPFREKFGVDVLDAWGPVLARLRAEEYLNVAGDELTLTRKGLVAVDSLLPRFYDDRYQNARYT